ncbi:MAG: anhydro-N-acetylmuramic acid kinase [Chitinophagales bacterium]
MLHNTVFHTIGLMSGSSLDGLDLCYVRFQNYDLRFEYEIIYADCIEYTNEFKERLRNAPNLSAFEFAKLHTEVGKYFGELTNDFIHKNKIEAIDFICSHGQTIFHQPNLGFTTQIGCGAQIAAQTNTKVVCDLRTSDVANGGQGAPIVPIAEKYLFADYKVFLNIGGIANIAFHKSESEHESESVIAYDVCAANTLLNYFAKQKGLEYDKDGNLARSGKINNELLHALNNIDFCNQAAPKSLGSEHIFDDWIPLFDKHEISIEDKLATAVEHIAMQVGSSIESQSSELKSQILITGGGAFNSFLTERIQYHTSLKVIVPESSTIQYKEAFAMAFIGLLRILEIPNCLSSVTGAKKDMIGGAVYLP